MPISTQNLLQQLSPMRGIDFSPVTQMRDRQEQKSAERARLELARQQFEFQKKQAEEDKQLRHLEEQGRMAREQMQAERAQAEAEREQQATLLAKQQEQLGEFGKLASSGATVQQAEAMSPLLDQLGYNVNNLGSVGGLPIFELVNRAQEQARAEQDFDQRARPIHSLDGSESATQSLNRMDGLGYPTNERGTLDEPERQPAAGALPTGETLTLGQEGGAGDLDEATTEALMPGDADLATAEEFGGGEGVADVSVGRGIGPASLSTGDAFAQALAASRYAQETGRPARGPDEEDYMGAVPRNVIDLPAMQAQTLARLNPALQARVAALPRELQEGAKANAAAIGGLGYETDAALKEFDTAMQDPVSIYNSQQNLKAEQEKRNTPSLMEISTFRERGAKALTDFAKDRGVTDVLNAVNKADELLRVIDDPTPENDAMIAPALMAAQGVKGVPSNVDLQYAFNAKSSLIGDIINAVEVAIQGGLSTAQRKAIKDYLQATKESQRKTVDDYLDNAFNRYDSDELNEYEKKGYLGALEQSVPASWHNDYWNRREKREGKGGRRSSTEQSAAAGEAGAELQRQAEGAGLNGQVLGKLMGGESGGKTNAASDKSSAKGVFQLTNETAKLMGFKDSADYAAQPLEKQIEVGLQLFKNKGITKDSSPEDYALVLAAPSLVGKWKSRDDVVYKKGSAEWEANAPWRPAGGGDITVGSIADYYMGKGSADKAPDTASGKAPGKAAELKLPEPKTPQEKRYLELLAKKRGG